MRVRRISRPDFAVLPSIERQNRTLAQITQRGVNPDGNAAILEDTRRLVKCYVEHYNNASLNSAIGYITPKDMLAGHQGEIQPERDRKLEAAREQRKNRRSGRTGACPAESGYRGHTTPSAQRTSPNGYLWEGVLRPNILRKHPPEGVSMKALTRYAILLASFLVIFVNVSYASETDPHVKTVGGGGSTPIFGTTFAFTYVSCGSVDGPSDESFCFNGDNVSGVDWHNLQVTTNYSFTGPAPTDWSCATTDDDFAMEFSTCTIQSVTNDLTTGTVVTLYSGGAGIPNSDPGTPDFFTTEGGDPTVTATTGMGNANVVTPEPGTLALFLTGIGAFAARRRLRRGRS